MRTCLTAILKKNVTRTQINVFARKHLWWWADFFRDSPQAVYEDVWMTRDDRTTIRYVEDEMLALNYFEIDGEKQKQVAVLIHRGLDTYNLQEIYQILRKATTPDEIIEAIHLVGVVSPQKFEPELFDFFQTVFANRDSKIRHEGIVATYYAGWRELEEPLIKIKNSDLDEELRDFASYTLDKFYIREWH